jgi:hypothetical protein
MDHTTTTGASVYEQDGVWILALESSTGDVVETIDTGWDGTGGFEQHGLNAVAPLLRDRDLLYQAWMEQDGRQVAVLYQRPSWGPR